MRRVLRGNGNKKLTIIIIILDKKLSKFTLWCKSGKKEGNPCNEGKEGKEWMNPNLCPENLSQFSSSHQNHWIHFKLELETNETNEACQDFTENEVSSRQIARTPNKHIFILIQKIQIPDQIRQIN